MQHRSRPALSAFLAVAALFAGPSAAQAPVRVAPVRAALVQRHDRVTGSLRAAHEAVIAALEEGALVEVLVKEAARVRAGEVLARTDGRRLEARLAELEADRARAAAELLQRRAELANAERDAEAMAAAAERNAVSERQARTARTDAEVAAARLAAAESAAKAVEASLALVRVRLDDATIRAPFDGRVVARHAEPGEWIRAGEPIVTLVSSGTLEAWLEVPERYAGAAADLEGPLVLELAATEAPVRAGRARLVPRVDSRARTFALVADVDDGGGALVPGMSVSAWLPVSERDRRILVPADAVVRRPGLTAVFRVREEDGAASVEQVPVSIVFETAEGTAVAGPLAEGERVVVEGNERLVPGAPVRVAAGASAAGRGETARLDGASGAREGRGGAR